MWKIIVRGIRETFERRICRTNIYSQSSGKSNEDNSKNDDKTNVTCTNICRPSLSIPCDNTSFCESKKSAGAEDENKRKSEWRASWPEAVGWSSVLAAGWVVCQTICLHKGIYGKNNKKTVKSKIYSHPGVSPIFAQLCNLPSRNVLPIINCIGDESEQLNLEDSNSQWTAEKAFGPITLEEAFDEAAHELEKTHKVVIGEYELSYGIKALEEKRYKDALKHFSTGAKLSSPGSMFNLGLCYELGIGTSVDQKKAAKYYNDAAAYDHADALYNMGVFYAQGRGGLPIDISTARTYFSKAAELGQEQAQHALTLEKAADACSFNEETWNQLSDYILKPTFFTKCMHEDNEKVVDNSNRVLLDILHFGNSSQTPIMITTNRYSM